MWRTDFLLDIYFERYGKGVIYQQAEEHLQWLLQPGPWVIEGCPMPFALREWRDRFDTKPCDVVYWLDRPYIELNPQRTSLLKACRAAYDDIHPWLLDVGVMVIENPQL